MKEDYLLEVIKETFLYGYPIVEMYELLHSQILNPQTDITNFNEFSHTAKVASPKTCFIPAPNNDTSYSRAWLALRDEPVIIHMPDTDDRYYSIQFLNLFSETLANVGRRTTGTKAKKFAVVGPYWNKDLPSDFEVVKSDTTFVLAFLRILMNDENDIGTVENIQNNIQIKTLTGSKPDIHGLPDYNNTTKREFFETLDAILRITPVIAGEENMAMQIKKCLSAPDSLLEEGCANALRAIEQGGLTFGDECNYWRIARKGIGNYGNDFLQRSVVWHKGALANQPAESLYPSTFQDSTGELLDGNFNYRLIFEKGQLPPVSQFWSLTMYIYHNAFLHENAFQRYSIGDRTEGLIYEEDGSLILYIQNEMPTPLKERANWLPSPPEKFFIVLRLYGPSDAVVSGEWVPPAVNKI